MMINSTKIKMLLKKRVFIILFFLIAFFAFTFKSNAAYFNYSDFDFDTFAEENKNYWTGQCVNEESEAEEKKCIEMVLSRQKIYYTRLYKLLAKYQKKGFDIDDNIIIATTFYELTPDLFTDDAEHYKKVTGEDGRPYNYDPNFDIDNYDVDKEPDYDYFENEIETLDLLIQNMFGYVSKCYGIYGNVDEIQNEDGSYSPNCPNGGAPTTVNDKYVCASTADSAVVGFWEYMSEKFNFKKFFGIKSFREEHCNALGSSYPDGTKYKMENKKQHSPETLKKYWEFLETSEYFDKKAHLKHHFSSVLNKTNKTSMKQLTSAEKEEYQEELITIRKKIVTNIKSILASHGTKVENVNLLNINNSLHWWPIGGADITTDSYGNQYAMGEPTTIIITSPFGIRNDPINNQATSHNGIDISGSAELGTINIIATKAGIITKVVDQCTSGGDSTCGGGYGNYVVISHADGTHTLYAHLHENTIPIKVNESINQGQIIGKMGNSGKSTGMHLHFEIMVGSNDSSSVVDPLTYISTETPRQNNNQSSDLHEMLVCLEGTGPDDGGSNYKVYDDAGNGSGTLTVGAGITLKYNVERFLARGIDTNNYNYVGALIPKNIVDDIKYEILDNLYDSINTNLSSNGINLTNYQIDALVSRQYNTGNITNFADNYRLYGNTQSLYNNYMSKPVTAVGFTGPVLQSRRDREWQLFHTGTYHKC